MKSKTAFLLALCFSCTALFSQVTFFRTYGTSAEQGGDAVKQCLDGGYIVSGFSRPAGQYNFYVLRVDSIGDTLWTRTFGGDNMVGFDVIQTSDSGFLVSGYKNSSNPYTHFIKLDASGNLTWARNVGPGWGQCVLESAMGGYVSAGIYLRRTDSNGYQVWACSLDYQAMYAVQNADSTYTIAGFLTDSVVINKRDTAGNTIWRKSYPGTMYNQGSPSNNVLAPTSDGGYIISGMVSSGNHSIHIIKTDASGDSLWTKTLPGLEGEGVVQTSDGGYAVCGWDMGNDDMILVKTDASGNVLWTKHYDYYGASDWTQSIRQTADNGFILAGSSYLGNSDVFLVKTDSLGNVPGMSVHESAVVNETSVYPNPASDRAVITFDHELTDGTITVYNSLGQMVQEIADVKGTAVSIQTAELPAGSYTIVAREEDAVVSQVPLVIVR